MKTLKYGIKHIEGGDKAKDLPLAMKQTAEAIVNALDKFNYNGKDPNFVLARVAALDAAQAETAKLTSEWVPLSGLPSGTTGRVRLNGGMVELLWESSNSIPTGFHTFASAVVPAEINGQTVRPTGNRFGVGYLSGYVVGTYVTSGGNLSLNNTSGAARSGSHTGQIFYTP